MPVTSVMAVVTDGITIGIASFAMETCTFCPRRTDTSHFEYYGPPLTGAEVLDYPWPGIAGFVHQIQQYPDVQTQGVYTPRWPVGGTMGSWITHKTFDNKITGSPVER